MPQCFSPTARPPSEYPFLDFDEKRFEAIKNTRRLYAIVSLNNTSQTDQPLWIYEDYALGLKLGAKFKLAQK